MTGPKEQTTVSLVHAGQCWEMTCQRRTTLANAKDLADAKDLVNVKDPANAKDLAVCAVLIWFLFIRHASPKAVG